MAKVEDVSVRLQVDLSELPEAIKQIEILHVRPEDIIILKCTQELDPEEAGDLRRSFCVATGLPNTVLVATAGMDLEVLRPDVTSVAEEVRQELLRRVRGNSLDASH